LRTRASLKLLTPTASASPSSFTWEQEKKKNTHNTTFSNPREVSAEVSQVHRSAPATPAPHLRQAFQVGVVCESVQEEARPEVGQGREGGRVVEVGQKGQGQGHVGMAACVA
jgi:hypothetical protein